MRIYLNQNQNFLRDSNRLNRMAEKHGVAASVVVAASNDLHDNYINEAMRKQLDGLKGKAGVAHG